MVQAKIKWLVDDSALGIESSQTELVDVDENLVAADSDAVIDWIESQLEDKYGVSFTAADETFVSDDEDFVVMNMADVVEELAARY